MRNVGVLDRLISNVDTVLRTVTGTPAASGRPYPAAGLAEAQLSDAERRHVAGLMRVDHAGEIAAQALYQAQALTARSPAVRDFMREAALEEGDHLDWCRRRLDELESHPSLLAPGWYAGSFAIGALAGLAGDRVSLGFVAETERQVEAHLGQHLERLPAGDLRSRAVLERMRDDEEGHARRALSAGALPLPEPIPSLMRSLARVMTGTAYCV